ncbi:YfhL family 4Fe-4S dicluster ferredoxin [Acinetobacter sp. MD2(2019)]|uniref:YfhL family 4Fe-4S dicluster ferredoxin n=1 Tax=Acinetobacter sp. MD2(2019) TaxID=2605273 RepID=UPI002D1F6C5A|nr:YfhL family 4Fe-4S dicluster ferredoxin [Acinetobacter sp. MD2(2019)]MEB3753440.1 YfhL family 4Fe-4S dicluster ferredoxin [Acinetobacter sp. MD2(2019)]
MALLITSDCINCDMCLAECPNNAISEGTEIYEIDAQHCTECVGFYEAPTCIEVCPIHCIEKDPNHLEDSTQLLKKFQALKLV